jgi:hypothetical protein
MGSAFKLDVGFKRSVEEQMTHAGMAYFANTGPIGAQCGACAWYVKGGCAMFHKLTRRRGERFPADTAACKYYDPEKRVIEKRQKSKTETLI